ncbi:MAG: DUF188 domain-containing protein [Dethiobacteria bacterium]|jgi:uncharacterized protein YaiI (UPF0178 family)
MLTTLSVQDLLDIPHRCPTKTAPELILYNNSSDRREFQPDNIDFLLEERELKAKYRRSGGRTKGPKKRTGDNDRRFEAGLERIIKGFNRC